MHFLNEQRFQTPAVADRPRHPPAPRIARRRRPHPRRPDEPAPLLLDEAGSSAWPSSPLASTPSRLRPVDLLDDLHGGIWGELKDDRRSRSTSTAGTSSAAYVEILIAAVDQHRADHRPARPGPWRVPEDSRRASTAAPVGKDEHDPPAPRRPQGPDHPSPRPSPRHSIRPRRRSSTRRPAEDTDPER